jgi:hypothetical protein
LDSKNFRKVERMSAAFIGRKFYRAGHRDAPRALAA